ncbi:nuclear transport factor 2 family protein [Antrihabitans stalactiti]|uniref:Nuclear transport factor 2 family protein n=1 Tax=Antrihabitans stalactiti TaxID=2584121 RepID=A0A848KMV1_9NOCA|nr:nuclear transport factor 2 family protein [Antrihabitans stalactiti]NMN99206.1 nuclear transport factor 2 family protein [Antrihabitans stalactiti]
MTNDQVARAFSGHRFDEAFDRLDENVVWNLIGYTRLEGRPAVVAACNGTTAGNVDVTTSWLRFVSTGDGDVVAVDAIGRYEGPDNVTAVSSCDIYEFTDGVVHTITSYTTEVNPDDYPLTGTRE